MGGTEGDPTGRGPMSEIWSTTATAIHTGASAYRKAVDPSSFTRKRCVSSAMAAALLEHTPCRSKVHAPSITLLSPQIGVCGKQVGSGGVSEDHTLLRAHEEAELIRSLERSVINVLQQWMC